MRDSSYAGDLLIAAVTSWISSPGSTGVARSARPIWWPKLGLAERPTDVLLTYCAAVGLIHRDVIDGDRMTITELARQHL